MRPRAATAHSTSIVNVIVVLDILDVNGFGAQRDPDIEHDRHWNVVLDLRARGLAEANKP